MKENRITEAGPLLGQDGVLTNPGYATSLLLEYRKTDVKASKWRLKEWDYYLVNDDKYALALTLADLHYAGLISASVIDFEDRSYKTSSALAILPRGSFNMPESSEQGVSAFSNKQVDFRFEVEKGVRKLSVVFRNFDGDKDLRAEVVLDEEPQDSMVIATPWAENPRAFYYNQKIVAMRAQGSFIWGDITHDFKPQDSFGLLDWGRGVWTYDNTWLWAAAQGWQEARGEAHRFGLNLGYGFGDTSAASENMAFMDGKAYKLGRVEFVIPPSKQEGQAGKGAGARYELMEPWRMVDDEGKLDLIFTPTIDRFDYMNYGAIVTDQHQVFGTYSGTVTLDDREFAVSDLKGFAEVVHNKY